MPGGLLQTNIISCAIFAAICGSSPATASAIGSVSYREMMEHRYNKSMIIGSLAGGGALGILIPPSITMIIYGAIVETSVEKLFIAGVVPGILAAVMFIFFIAIACMIKKDFCPPKPARPSFVEMMKALVQMSPFFILILIVLGSIYAGFATTTEAAALGALGAVICSLAVKGLNWEKLKIALNATIKNTTMIMILVVCAKVLSYFVVISGISRELTSWIVAVNPSKPLFLLIITVMYLILGCIMDGASMMYITIPVLLPMLTAMGFDLTWFGVLMVVLVELSMITPPVGLNLYVLHGVCNNLGIPTSFGEVVNGSVPYCLLYLLLAFILMLFPQLALWLPGIM